MFPNYCSKWMLPVATAEVVHTTGGHVTYNLRLLVDLASFQAHAVFGCMKNAEGLVSFLVCHVNVRKVVKGINPFPDVAGYILHETFILWRHFL